FMCLSCIIFCFSISGFFTLYLFLRSNVNSDWDTTFHSWLYYINLLCFFFVKMPMILHFLFIHMNAIFLRSQLTQRFKIRSRLLEDAFDQLSLLSEEDLKGP
ncbi:hypothetical protein ACJX0J_034403, partial [Zea mays]